MDEIRPIDANELKDSIVENIRELGDQCSPVMLTMFGLFSDIIDNAPTVEPERPKGEWQITKAGYAKCPYCRCEREIPENFCGYCGADMRGNEK